MEERGRKEKKEVGKVERREEGHGFIYLQRSSLAEELKHTHRYNLTSFNLLTLESTPGQGVLSVDG